MKNSTDTIEWAGLFDTEWTFDEIAAMAFDKHTPDELATHYQEKLKAVIRFSGRHLVAQHRFIFLMNPETKRLRIVMD